MDHPAPHSSVVIPLALARRLHREAKAERWGVSVEQFAAALHESAERASPHDLPAYCRALHLQDLALACACRAGDERAWEHFVREHRPVLYRAADALQPGGGARELADSLYAELYGLQERDGQRRSLFRYFHGRSSLATWLRAVLAQRVVDAARVGRRLDPLPEDDHPVGVGVPQPSLPDPDRTRYGALVRRAVQAALSSLDARDRLRLGCYYAQELTLAETGRLLREHEATVSRHLAKTRRAMREHIERYLQAEGKLNADQIARCLEYAVEDTGPLDLGGMLRKESESDRSI
jgi:RNA polymerase sigma-70 factor (ECF subfamily)